MTEPVVVVNQYPEQLPIGNPRQSLPPADGGGEYIDPVLGAYLTDPANNSAPRLQSNPRLSLGSVKQPNFKVQRNA